MQGKRRSILLTVFMLGVMILACNVPGRPDATPPPPAPPEDVQPTPFVQPSPIPRDLEANPDVETRLLAQRPNAGEDLPLDGAIDLYFNQPMDQTSVADALRITPDVGYEIEWLSNAAARITPTDLDRDTRYTLELSETARSTLGNGLTGERRFEVETVGFISVTDYTPSAPTPTDTPITVFFNQPIVPLTSLGQSADLPAPLRFSPEVPGEGEWVGTSIYRWHPSNPLMAGTSYTITVGAGLEDQIGNILAEDVMLTFRTVAPEVTGSDIETVSSDGPMLPSSPFMLTFNQPMDAASTEAAFSLQTADGGTVSGELTWEENFTQLTFTPDALLEAGTSYTAELDDSALGYEGAAPLTQPFAQQVTTAPLPAVTSTSPEGDEVYPYGEARFAFNTVMNEDTLYEEGRISILPEPEGVFSTYATPTSVAVYARFAEGQSYTVTLNPGAEDRFGNIIDEPYTFSFTTQDAPPRVQINLREAFGLYNAANPVEIALVTTNFSEVGLALYAIEDVQGAMADVSATPQGPPLREWSVDTSGAENDVMITPVTVSEGLAPGVYRLLVTNFTEFEQPITHTLVVSNTHVTMKTSFEESLVWATGLESGNPVTGADVTVYSNFDRAGITQIGSGETNSDGIALMTTAPIPRLPVAFATYSDQRTYALVEGDGVFGMGLSDWSQETQPNFFDVQRAFAKPDQTLYLYTDRPLYRPGDTVHIKGVLRNKDDMRFSIPNETVTMAVRGSNFETGDNFSFEATFPLDEFGAFAGDIQLPDDAPLGTYTIDVEASGTRTDYIAGGPYSYAAGGFQVAEYVKPEYEVIVDPAVGEVLDGEEFETTIAAVYFSGGRVSEAPLSYRVESFPHSIAGPAGYTFDDPETYIGSDEPFGFGRFVSEAQATLDENGSYTLTTRADLGQEALTRRYVIEGVVTDEANQPVSARESVIVHAAETYVGLNPVQPFVAAGEPAVVDVLTLDWKGKPTADQPVRVQLYQQTWQRVRVFDETGGAVWQWQQSRTPVGDALLLETNTDGRAEVEVPIDEPGPYRIVATTEDANGRVHQASVFMWATGGEFTAWRAGSADKQLDVITDKDAYAVGETAEVLITSPFEGQAQALITVERGGILFNDVITVEGGATRYDLDIPQGYAPNAYISVTLYQGGAQPGYRFGLTEIAVSAEPRLLDVSVTADEEIIAPGQPVTFTVTTRDAQGNPADAQVSLAVVDKALLALTEPNSLPIEAHFFPPQPLGVLTSVGLSAFVEAQLVELVPTGGGRGGGGGGGEGSPPPLREQFEDTAYWSATIRTGESGTAEVTVTMPDNLTTWVMDARAITQETEVGQAQAEFQATLPLLVRPVTPRFLVEGDRALVSAVVNNNTEGTVDATLTLEANGVSLQEEAAKQVTVPAGGRQVVYWAITADQGSENAELIFRVEGGGFSDAARPAIGERGLLPIYRYETIETLSTSGVLAGSGSRTEGIAVPPDLVTPSGELVVTLAPSLAGSTLDGLSYLKTYPYQSTEQIVSRFLPNTVTLLALRSFSLDYPQFEQGLEEQINTALAELERDQLPNGAWGWSFGGRSEADLLTTAYAVEGLLTAREAGYTVSTRMLTRALDYLQQAQVNMENLPPAEQLGRRAYQQYVLSLAGMADVQALDDLYAQRDEMPAYGVGFLALSIANSTDDAEQLSVLRDELTRAAVLDANGAHWPDEAIGWSTDIRSTAVVLNAFAQLWPDSDLLPNAVRWLMVARTGDHWTSSQETAWSVMALSRVMANTGELDPDYTWSLLVDGSQRLSGAANRQNATESERLSIPLVELIEAGVTPLTVQRTDGPGQLYYTADLMLRPPVEQVQAADRGIHVTRRYLNAEGEAVTRGQVGDELVVEVTMIAEHDLYYVVLEDYYPAGAAGIDDTLLTERQLGQSEPPSLTVTGWGWWQFDAIQLRDEKALLTADYLPAGTYQYTYRIRLTTPGEFRVIPTAARQLYTPGVFGREAGMVFVIEE